MSGKDSPQSVIDAHRRRQQMTPFLVWGAVVLLVVVGVIILLVWFSGTNKTAMTTMLTSPTPTSTNTVTPTPVTPTATATVTSSPTATATATATNTPAGPVEYVVKEGDNCYAIATEFKADIDVLMTLNNFGNTCPIKPGQKILIPLPGQELPTETPLPPDFPAGKTIEYTVKSGETLALIASKFNSSVEAILAIKENGLTSETDLKARQKLIVPVNIVTPTPTKAPTATKTPGGPTETPMLAPATPTATATKS